MMMSFAEKHIGCGMHRYPTQSRGMNAIEWGTLELYGDYPTEGGRAVAR